LAALNTPASSSTINIFPSMVVVMLPVIFSRWLFCSKISIRG
jgi:hypothetical protein